MPGLQLSDDRGSTQVDEASIIATARDYPSLLAGLIARRKELGLAQHVVDEIAGLTTAYTGKIECGMKRMGAMSLEALLGALGIELVLIRTTPHHLRQKRVLGSSCGVVRRGPAQIESHVV